MVGGEAVQPRVEQRNRRTLQLYRRGKLPETLASARKALRLARRGLGLLHPDTAQSLHTLGFLLRATGELAAARPYAEQALAIRQQLLGPTTRTRSPASAA